jgi:hypothetical protein
MSISKEKQQLDWRGVWMNQSISGMWLLQYIEENSGIDCDLWQNEERVSLPPQRE